MTPKNIFPLSIIIALLVMFPPLTSQAGMDSGVVQQSLQARSEQGEDSFRVIVLLKNRPDLQAVSFSSGSAGRRHLQDFVTQSQETVINQMSAQEFRLNIRFQNIPAFGATVTREGLKTLAAQQGVAFIQEDLPIYPRSGTSPSAIDAKPMARLDLYSGQKVAIAVVGTGINYENSVLGGGGFPNSKVIGGYDFGDNDNDPLDCQGHETGVAVVAGYTVAPGAKLYALKICPGCCASEPSWVSKMIAAWDWCVSHRDDNPDYPIRIINTSWADYSIHTSPCDETNPAVALAAAACKAAGIAIFVAAGNENLCDGLPMPSCMSDIFSVGSVYKDDGSPKTYCLPWQSCSSWPSNGCGGRIYACRDDVVAKDKVSCCSNSAEFLSLLAPSGGQTSGAAPYAAGAAAVLQSYIRETEGDYLSVDEMIRRLYGYSEWIYDMKANRSTRRIEINELIDQLEKE